MSLNTLERRVYQLFLLNLVLQIFDGIATYQGILHGNAEANPLVLASMATLGAGPALLLYKAKACGLLLLIRRLAPAQTSIEALRMLAAAYFILSLLPWWSWFVGLLCG